MVVERDPTFKRLTREEYERLTTEEKAAYITRVIQALLPLPEADAAPAESPKPDRLH
jgi:hypothetical protein